jgi:hypothetical protein
MILNRMIKQMLRLNLLKCTINSTITSRIFLQKQYLRIKLLRL